MEFDKTAGVFMWDSGLDNNSLVDQVSMMCLKEMLMYCQIPCTILKEDKIFDQKKLKHLIPILFKNRRSSWELEELVSEPTKVLLELRIREVFTDKKLRAFKEAESWGIKNSMLQGVVAEFRDFSEGISTDEHVHVLRKRENYKEWMWTSYCNCGSSGSDEVCFDMKRFVNRLGSLLYYSPDVVDVEKVVSDMYHDSMEISTLEFLFDEVLIKSIHL